jgi:hypothetical protein
MDRTARTPVRAERIPARIPKGAPWHPRSSQWHHPCRDPPDVARPVYPTASAALAESRERGWSCGGGAGEKEKQPAGLAAIDESTDASDIVLSPVTPGLQKGAARWSETATTPPPSSSGPTPSSPAQQRSPESPRIHAWASDCADPGRGNLSLTGRGYAKTGRSRPLGFGNNPRWRIVRSPLHQAPKDES